MYRCEYEVTFLLDNNRSRWRLIEALSHPVAYCPWGVFDRAR